MKAGNGKNCPGYNQGIGQYQLQITNLIAQKGYLWLASFLYNSTKIISMKQDDNKIVGDNTIKNPDNWTTGEEPMTGAQSSYLHTLASEAGETIEDNLTKAEASKKIEELQQKTGRGLEQSSNK